MKEKIASSYLPSPAGGVGNKVLVPGWGINGGKTMEREVDPNAVTRGKIRETKGKLLLTKAEIQKQTKMGQTAK